MTSSMPTIRFGRWASAQDPLPDMDEKYFAVAEKFAAINEKKFSFLLSAAPAFPDGQGWVPAPAASESRGAAIGW
jgi:hypothetical protein